MTLEDAGKKFVLPLSTLEQYVSFGFIKKSGKRGKQKITRKKILNSWDWSIRFLAQDLRRRK